MSALKENQCYGLSSGKLDRGGNVSVFHVKLTDSAARAVESFQKAKGCSSHPTISFNGNQGRITIPCSDNEMRIFTFGMTIVGSDNPQGSFDCVRQLSTGAAEELSCLGVIQKKMTVNATDDSYDKARQSMAQAEEETRSRGAIVIKHGGRYQGKKVTVRAPSPALARLAKPRNLSQTLHCNTKRRLSISKSQKSAFASNGKSKSEVKERPLRERVTHLLALRPYKKPELILRLQKDELTAEDRNELESVLMEVGHLNSKDNTFVLKDSLFKDVQKDWPGYTTGDQQLLKRILVRRLFQPQRNLLTVPEAQVSPLRDTPNSSPAHRPLHSQTKRYTDPLAHKKPRISRISNKTAKEQSSARPSQQEIHKDLTEPTGNDGQKNSLDPRRLLDSLSAVCQQEAEAVDRFEPTPCAQEEPKATAQRPQPNSDRSPSASRPDGDTIKRKRHKNRDQEDKWRDKKNRAQDRRSEEPTNSVSPDCTQPCEILDDTNAIQDTDYRLSYTVICSYDQRQSYKQEFNREYSEYRDLHARIENVTRQFMELNAQLKQLNHKSLKYKMVHLKIIQEYRKIRKSNPDYRQEKIRCEYLHNKLAHIKKLISEYDQQQLCLAEED